MNHVLNLPVDRLVRRESNQPVPKYRSASQKQKAEKEELRKAIGLEKVSNFKIFDKIPLTYKETPICKTFK